MVQGFCLFLEEANLNRRTLCCSPLLCCLRGSFLFVCRAIAATDLEEMAAVGFQGDSEAKYRRYTITTTRKYKHVENVEHVLGGVLQVQSVVYICSRMVQGKAVQGSGAAPPAIPGML